MPFGLKNVGATYQRLVKRMFKNQIGINMKVYVDDPLVKSGTIEQYLNDLRFMVFNTHANDPLVKSGTWQNVLSVSDQESS